MSRISRSPPGRSSETTLKRLKCQSVRSTLLKRPSIYDLSQRNVLGYRTWVLDGPMTSSSREQLRKQKFYSKSTIRALICELETSTTLCQEFINSLGPFVSSSQENS